MRLVSVSMVRNEADIIEAFVRYHCAVFDAMVIVDHSSVDGTVEILEQLRDEGLPLRLQTEGGAAQDQSRVVTRAARGAVADDGADLVIPLDADEFLVAPGSSEVRAAAARLAANADTYFQVRWITYVPSADDPAGEPNVLRRIRHRREPEVGEFRKVLVPGRLLLRGLTLEYGSHGVNRHGWIWHRKFRSGNAPDLAIAHFPVRSVEQLMRKVLVGWPSNLARADRKGPQSGHWQVLYERFKRGAVPDERELPELALAYYGEAAQPGSPDSHLVLDPVLPVGGGFELRYVPSQAVPLVSVLTSAMERLAVSLAERGPPNEG